MTLLLLTFLCSCDRHTKNQTDTISAKTDSTKLDTSKKENWQDKVLKSIPKHLKPIFGYRFVIKGDFDGDGKKETLIEHFFSSKEKRETNKFYDSLEYDQLIVLAARKEPISFLTSDDNKIDTLHIARAGQLLGLSFLKNEGDLDGDGGDEAWYVVYWADWSAVNTCHLVSYKHGKWKELYSFQIRDWQLPDLPEVQNQYGLFGVDGVNSTIGNDTANARLEKELEAFPGFIKKHKNGKIRVLAFTPDASADSTPIINLKRWRQKR